MEFVTEPNMREFFFYFVLALGIIVFIFLAILSPILVDLIRGK